MSWGPPYTWKLEQAPAFMDVMSIKITTHDQQVALTRTLRWLDPNKIFWWTRGRSVFRIERSVESWTWWMDAMNVEHRTITANRHNAYGRHVSTLTICCLMNHVRVAAVKQLPQATVMDYRFVVPEGHDYRLGPDDAEDYAIEARVLTK